MLKMSSRRLGKSPYIPLFKRGTEGDLDLTSLELLSRNSKHDSWLSKETRLGFGAGTSGSFVALDEIPHRCLGDCLAYQIQRQIIQSSEAHAGLAHVQPFPAVPVPLDKPTFRLPISIGDGSPHVRPLRS